MKNNDYAYRPIIVGKRNNSRVSKHQQLQLQRWHENCVFQLLTDHYACAEYVAKYAAKRKKMSSIVRNAFVAIANQTNLNTDPKATVPKLFLKCFGNRDFGTQEVMHQIMPLKLWNSLFNVITVSLNGS